MKRILAIVLTLVMIWGLVPVSASAEEKYFNDGFDIGDEILFGYYDQDNIKMNGDEEIEWVILDRDKNNHILVISKYIIDTVPYASYNGKMTWENSYIRSYLNGSFYKEVFSNAPEGLICDTELNTPDGRSGTRGGADTTDKIFILSIEELLYYLPKESSRKAEPTEYAKELGAEYDVYGCGWYWARNPGKTQDTAAGVHVGGGINYDGRTVEHYEGIRPAMWLDLNVLDE